MPAPWRKLGRVLEPLGGPLSRTHVMVPTPWVTPDHIRVFYSSSDADQRGRVFFADFAPEPPFAVIRAGSEPVFDVGPPGTFDCDGVNPSQVLMVDGRLALLYVGWQRGPAETPYTLFGGLAVSDDEGLSFTRWKAPLLGPVPGERFFRTAPFVQRDGDGWRMLYIGGDGFTAAEGGRRLPVYSIMQLKSPSLFDWDGPGQAMLRPDVEAGEIGFGRPVVTPQGGLMVSLRTRSGYTLVETSLDFAPGTRPAMAPVIPPPLEPWESAMTCFGAPCVVGDNELLFYNGDGYGASGLGLCWRPLR